MITNWDQPFTLRSQLLGDLDLNTTSGQRFILVAEECSDIIPLRVTRTPIPAADGMIPNQRFLEGYTTSMTVQFWVDEGPACDQDLTEMTDDLMGWLGSMLNEEGRLLWTPYSGYGDERMYDEARWNERAEWSLADGGFTRISFGIDTPFPYAIDSTQQTITVTSGTSPLTLTNTGNTTHWPVIKVFGSANSFTIENLTTGEMIVWTDSWDPGILGVGDYAEIDTFRNTMYLNGTGANLKPGLDIELSDFWGLQPGANQLSTAAATFDVLFNPPWL